MNLLALSDTDKGNSGTRFFENPKECTPLEFFKLPVQIYPPGCSYFYLINSSKIVDKKLQVNLLALSETDKINSGTRSMKFPRSVRLLHSLSFQFLIYPPVCASFYLPNSSQISDKKLQVHLLTFSESGKSVDV